MACSRGVTGCYTQRTQKLSLSDREHLHTLSSVWDFMDLFDVYGGGADDDNDDEEV